MVESRRAGNDFAGARKCYRIGRGQFADTCDALPALRTFALETRTPLGWDGDQQLVVLSTGQRPADPLLHPSHRWVEGQSAHIHPSSRPRGRAKVSKVLRQAVGDIDRRPSEPP